MFIPKLRSFGHQSLQSAQLLFLVARAGREFPSQLNQVRVMRSSAPDSSTFVHHALSSTTREAGADVVEDVVRHFHLFPRADAGRDGERPQD